LTKPSPAAKNTLSGAAPLPGPAFTGHFGARHGGIRCADIAGDLIGTPEVKQVCGVVVVETYVKVMELLAENAV